MDLVRCIHCRHCTAFVHPVLCVTPFHPRLRFDGTFRS
jgi:hypothetical protein